MKTGFLFAAACMLTQSSTAQPLPTRSFMVGPVVGTDQVGYANLGGMKGGSSDATPGGLIMGAEAAYRVDRWLFGAKLMYRKRAYESKPAYTGPRDSGFPSPLDNLSQIDTDLQVLSIPLSAGYRIAHNARFDWYMGGNVGIEALLSTSDRLYKDRQGTILLTQPAVSGEYGRRVNVGFGIQTTFCYFFTPALALQVEPAVRVYPSGGFPSRTYSTFQFQGTAAVLVKL